MNTSFEKDYRERKQKLNLLLKMVNRWRNKSKRVFCLHSVPADGPKVGTTGVEKAQNKLTYKHAQFSGENLNCRIGSI